MVNTTTNNDDLLILSDDNTIDFPEVKEEKKENNDDFNFTILEESPVQAEVNSTKNELSDLLSDTTNTTKNSLWDLSSILWDSKKEEVKNEESNDFLIIDETLVLEDKKNDENIFDDKLEKKALEDLKNESKNNLDFWNILSEEAKPEEKIEVKNEEKAEENIFFGDILETPKTEEVKKEETPKIEEKINIPEIISPISEEKNTLISTSKVWDMSEILALTIENFSKRESIIWKEISTVESHIKELEAELKEQKDSLAELKSEEIALKNNREAIEKMKSDYENPVSKTKKTSK